MDKKISLLFAIAVIVLFAGFLTAMTLLNGNDFPSGGDQNLPGNKKPGNFVCTQEAKLCPDGSSVSRTGPNCEFAPCTGEGIKVNSQKEKTRLEGVGCYEKDKDGSVDLYNLKKDFNLDPPNEVVLYVNEDKGISFNISYNKKWGNKDCKVAAYLESNIENNFLVEFGKPRAWEAGPYFLFLVEKRTTEDVIRNENGRKDLRLSKLVKADVVVSSSRGMSDERYYEIVGKDSNFMFQYTNINGLSEEGIAEIEKTIESVKILP